MTIRLICLDADDTLWHNMRYFNAAEDVLVEMLRPFADAGKTRGALVACEVGNLALYGYGAKGFTLSMVETAVQICGDRLTAAMVAEILKAGQDLLAHPVELLDGVAETLDLLAGLAPLVLVTKGDLLHQEIKLAASGLGERFAGVDIVSDKTAGTFRRLFERHGVQPGEAIMAGDSLRSDVLPALEAGAWAAFIPQEGGWSHERAVPPDEAARYAELASLTGLPALIERINDSARTSRSPAGRQIRQAPT